MEITVREFRSEDTKEAIAIWNEVVDQGKAFPQLEDLGVEDGEAFFKEQSYTGIAVNENDEIVGLYILHPNNIGRCGHICNASYAVKSTVRGQGVGKAIVTDCLEKAKEMMHWDEKFPARDLGNGKVRGVGVAMAMQGSSISNVDNASVAIKVNDDGFYSLMIGASDMGTGCDTILAQMAADCLDCEMENIIVSGVDTDVSPYDSGSYASSTTYLTGIAVMKTCETLKEKILAKGAQYLECSREEVDFDGKKVFCLKDGREISLMEIGNRIMCNNEDALFASESYSSPVSPPPFMVGMAEVDVDQETGEIELVDYVAVVDCGTVVNPSLARVQTEGGIAQGIGMALYEDVVYSESGKNFSNSFMQYKIPSRQDVGTIRVEFESSYEPTGPFGAKSIGEVVINTPSPAIAQAVYNASGVRVKELPITAEKVYWGMKK